MEITHDNKNKIEDLYLHDFNITEFVYSDLEKSISMQAVSQYLRREIHFNFINIMFCEITGEKSPGGIDILDWYVLPDTNQFDTEYRKIPPVGMALVKSSWDTIKIYCEKIEIKEIELQDKNKTISVFDVIDSGEQLTYSFIEIRRHIEKYKDKDIEKELEVYDYTAKEKEEKYTQRFLTYEQDIIRDINTIKKYQDIIKDEDLNYIINKLLEVYNKKNITAKEKRQLYLKVNEELIRFDFEKMYARILDCVYKGLIK